MLSVQQAAGINYNNNMADHRGGYFSCKVELPAGSKGLGAAINLVAQVDGDVPAEGGQRNLMTVIFQNPTGTKREIYVQYHHDAATYPFMPPTAIPVGQDTVWLRILTDNHLTGEGWVTGHYSLDGAVWVPIGQAIARWPQEKIKPAGWVQVYAFNELGNTAGTVKLDDVYWSGRGTQRWPVIEGEVAGGLTATKLQAVKPTALEPASAAGAPKVVAGIHLEPPGIASTTVVSTQAVVKLAVVLRPFGIALTTVVGSPRVPTYPRYGGKGAHVRPASQRYP